MMNDEETTSISTYVSLCSGYDGIGIGLKRAIPNLRTIAHVEIETYAIANLIAKMEAGQLDACPVFTDLKQFPYRELRDRVTILSAGFPCQPFSSAGKRQATEDPRHLYPWIADGITAMRPRYVLLENVEGIISAKTADGESVLKYVLGDLESRGYSCTWGIFSASEVGAPHQRKRVFILGNSSSVGSCGGSEDEGKQRTEMFRQGYESTESQGHNNGTGDVDKGLGKTKYPARPGQDQHEWEEPRTTITELGGTANGTSYRVDRLRLLGNGVVPDTCELAFKTLIKQLR
jgi:DNA (cytosine-5)-methyltransferase 1